MEKSHLIKRTYLAMLLGIGEADGKLDMWEEQFVDTIAQKLQIQENEKDEIKREPSKYITQLPDSYSQRLEFFYNLLFMMGIDNSINAAERALCKEIGFRLCFNPLLIDDLIAIMVENLGKKVPVDQVIQAIIKYQN